MPEIGFLNSGSRSEFAHLLAAFREGLKSKGYKVVTSAAKGPKDVLIDAQWANGDYSQLPAKAKLLNNKRVKVLVATGGIMSAQAARDYAASSGSQIPILFLSGRAESKPGDHGPNSKAVHLGTTTRNIHGHNRHKRLRELLGEDANIYQLINRDGVVNDDEGAWPKSVTATNVSELKAAFDTAVKQNKADAILVSGDPFFNRRRAEIIALANKHKVPACYPWREYVEAGGLMSHGPNLSNAYRKLGIWTGMVLDGAGLDALPNAEERHRELVINLKAVKKLSLPPANLDKLLLMADAVIS
jgi:putative tryptophan/tyrosine transport system substrate-binding protein